MPRDEYGFIDERKIYNLLGKCRLPIDCLFDISTWELCFYAEGVFEDDRQTQEYIGINLFSSIRQALGKTSEFRNPFEKQEIEQVKKPATLEDKAETEDLLADIFGI